MSVLRIIVLDPDELTFTKKEIWGLLILKNLSSGNVLVRKLASAESLKNGIVKTGKYICGNLSYLSFLGLDPIRCHIPVQPALMEVPIKARAN